jgi:hypothetical protein
MDGRMKSKKDIFQSYQPQQGGWDQLQRKLEKPHRSGYYWLAGVGTLCSLLLMWNIFSAAAAGEFYQQALSEDILFTSKGQVVSDGFTVKVNDQKYQARLMGQSSSAKIYRLD